jgi:hypothetical protein
MIIATSVIYLIDLQGAIQMEISEKPYTNALALCNAKKKLLTVI